MMEEKSNGWNEYSKMVLKELTTLADGMEALQKELQEVRRDIAKIETRESKVIELKEWKQKMTDVLSPDQLKDLVKEHRENRDFMIRSIAVLSVVQFIVASAVVWMKIFQK